MSTRSKSNADQLLGMQEPIRRRDFLNATLLAAGGALVGAGSSHAPADALAPGYGGVGDYSRSNGNTPEVMEAAHAIRDKLFEPLPAGVIDTGEIFDLIVVG